MTGVHAATAILAALHGGGSRRIELSLIDTALASLVNVASGALVTGQEPRRFGNAHPHIVPYQPFRTADGWVAVAAANDGLFRKLCQVIGQPELADDPRFVRNADRTAHRGELRPILVEALSTRGAEEWFDSLVDAGVPCGPINSVAGGFAIAERFGLDPVVSVGEGDRAVPTTRNPIRFSATPAVYELPPPELDEHGDALRSWLTTTEDE
jgi:crotonobetainyl-CoA:carnitine CoA-transferase CaiB-like acyl-CoA transferase